jgi:hypothetical protein
MLYAILAYHVERSIVAMSPEEDAALMATLDQVHDRLAQAGNLGPAARLGATEDAVTVRNRGIVVDGPFAETKEHLLGFYVMDFATKTEAINAAKDLQQVNPTAVYEIRPITLFRPGADVDDGILNP